MGEKDRGGRKDGEGRKVGVSKVWVNVEIIIDEASRWSRAGPLPKEASR